MKAVEIEANLLAVCGNQKVTFCAAGNEGVLSFPNVDRSTAGVFNLLPLFVRSRDNFRQLHRGCTVLGLSLTLEVCGRAVAQVGQRCKPGMFSRLLCVYPAEVRLLPLLFAMMRAALAGDISEREL